mmetsp:Transcript_6193/g.14808  ORF Transcript_6193/g.14808 Transcript_6193/m.14808 type:complete len:223 (-) Transcript_6193:63-731(-)
MQFPVRRMPSATVRSIARRLCLSITTSSPSASSFIMTVPPADKNAMPSPCSRFKNIPWPPQQQAAIPLTRSSRMVHPSPFAPRNAPLCIAKPLCKLKSMGTILAGKLGVRARRSCPFDVLRNFKRKKDSPAHPRAQAWPTSPISASISIPDVMKSIECGSDVINSPGPTVNSSTWLKSLPVSWKSLSAGGADGVHTSKPECIACWLGATAVARGACNMKTTS